MNAVEIYKIDVSTRSRYPKRSVVGEKMNRWRVILGLGLVVLVRFDGKDSTMCEWKRSVAIGIGMPIHLLPGRQGICGQDAQRKPSRKGWRMEQVFPGVADVATLADDACVELCASGSRLLPQEWLSTGDTMIRSNSFTLQTRNL